MCAGLLYLLSAVRARSRTQKTFGLNTSNASATSMGFDRPPDDPFTLSAKLNGVAKKLCVGGRSGPEETISTPLSWFAHSSLRSMVSSTLSFELPTLGQVAPATS